MTRRQATRQAVLFAFGMALGKLDSLKAEGGQLTCDLNQWSTIVFKHGKKTITIPVAEVFAALAEGRNV
jgi:methyl coenzyme M reductase subunit C